MIGDDAGEGLVGYPETTPEALVLALLLTTALAMAQTYGDAAGNGFPTWDDRAVHLWTNAVRVAPADFEAEYNSGGCSYHTDFTATEQTAQVPLLWNQGLNEVARLHSQDF